MAAPAATLRRAQGLPPWVFSAGGQVLALGAAFVFAGVIGSFIILAYHESPLHVYRIVWTFSTARPSDFARVLVNATPLIFSGLALAVAFKAGLFNIGVEGQYIVGMMTATAAAVTLRPLPAPVLLPLVVLAAVIGSTAWATVPAVLKVKTGAHEVVTTIMMNGIATSLVAWALLHPLKTKETGLIDLRSAIFTKRALVPKIAPALGLERKIPSDIALTWLFPLALVACAAVWFLLYRTRLGYDVRATGSSAGSAEAGGVSIGAVQIKVFMISGALAGFVGLNDLLGDRGYLGNNYTIGLGFAGIAVAFLGRNSPLGIALAAVLIGMLERGQDGLAVQTNLPTEILIILQGLLILSVVVAYELVSRRLARRLQRVVRAEEPGGEAKI